MKKQRFITNHDENFRIAEFFGIIAVIVFAFYTVKGLFIGDTIIGGFIKSWTSGYGIVILIFIVINERNSPWPPIIRAAAGWFFMWESKYGE